MSGARPPGSWLKNFKYYDTVTKTWRAKGGTRRMGQALENFMGPTAPHAALPDGCPRVAHVIL